MEPFPAWLYETDEVLRAYGVDAGEGLSEEDAQELLKIHGPNELEKEEGKGLWELFLEQFDDLLVKILRFSLSIAHHRNL